MLKYKLTTIITVCILVGISVNRDLPTKSIFEYKDILRVALAREPIISDNKLVCQKNGLDYENYFVMASIAITKLFENPSDESAKQIVDSMKGTFYRNGYFPRPEYIDLPYGWVSSMDAPVIALASQMIYEITGDGEYKKFVSDISDYIIKDVSENGFVANIDGEKWLFEYAY